MWKRVLFSFFLSVFFSFAFVLCATLDGLLAFQSWHHLYSFSNRTSELAIHSKPTMQNGTTAKETPRLERIDDRINANITQIYASGSQARERIRKQREREIKNAKI